MLATLLVFGSFVAIIIGILSMTSLSIGFLGGSALTVISSGVGTMVASYSNFIDIIQRGLEFQILTYPGSTLLTIALIIMSLVGLYNSVEHGYLVE